MTWLTEDPWPIVYLGLAVGAILLVAAFQTGRTVFLLGVVAVALFVGGWYGVERWIVTDREEVEEALDNLAAALERDDQPAILAALSARAPGARRKAQAALAIYKVTTARVANLKITLNELTSPPTARAEFTGRLDVEVRRAGHKQTAVRRFTLIFQREPDGWRLADYEFRE